MQVYLCSKCTFLYALPNMKTSESRLKKIHMTQATVSRNISLLEEQIGLILFVRHHQKVHLTPAGRQFAKELEKVLARFQQAAEDAFKLQRCEYNKVIIGDYDTTSIDDYLWPIVNGFENLYPESEVSIIRRHPQDIIAGMKEKRFDIIFAMAITQDMFEERDTKVETILELDPKVVISKKHSCFNKPELSYTDLFGCTIILLKEPEYTSYNTKTRIILQNCGFPESAFYYADDPYDISLELQRGEKIAILDALFAPDGKQNYRYVDLPGCGEKFGVQIAYSQNEDNPFLSKFIKAAKQIQL